MHTSAYQIAEFSAPQDAEDAAPRGGHRGPEDMSFDGDREKGTRGQGLGVGSGSDFTIPTGTRLVCTVHTHTKSYTHTTHTHNK